MHELTARQPKRVLLVEDDPAFAFLTKTTLEELVSGVDVGDEHQSACICGKWIVTCADTLAKATAALRSNSDEYDLILLDMMLPDGCREDAVRIVHDAAPDVPIVVQSGISDIELVSTLLLRGEISDYIVKGNANSPRALKQVVCHAIDFFHTKCAGLEFSKSPRVRAATKNINGESSTSGQG